MGITEQTLCTKVPSLPRARGFQIKCGCQQFSTIVKSGLQGGLEYTASSYPAMNTLLVILIRLRLNLNAFFADTFPWSSDYTSLACRAPASMYFVRETNVLPVNWTRMNEYVTGSTLVIDDGGWSLAHP
ncbi:hypothetical protein BST61_g1286 [Cercospora zeina]